ncbi:MAG: L-ribulose-5-phosphate 4-epimerase [Phycisphaerae bacterium]|jgi:L-ribulose-5-phosphate 4-epimerase
MLEALKESVCQANLDLVRHNLIIFSWGNVSGIDRDKGIVAIKPSGVDYASLSPKDIVLLDLYGNIVEGKLKPSSDTPTHLEFYRQWKDVGGVCHTHSPFATSFAQAKREIPALGTTHADYFYGTIPVTRDMTEAEIKTDYELNTGKVIVERFSGIDPMSIPAVLTACHGPFTWGKTAAKSVENAVVLENVAMMAACVFGVNPNAAPLSSALLDKHYLRKHGATAYYGQN